MKNLLFLLILVGLGLAVNAQTASTDVLATATGVKIRPAELPKDARSIYERRAEIVASNRSKFLEQTVSEMLLSPRLKRAEPGPKRPIRRV